MMLYQFLITIKMHQNCSYRHGTHYLRTSKYLKHLNTFDFKTFKVLIQLSNRSIITLQK